jgi:hypothetical protein
MRCMSRVILDFSLNSRSINENHSNVIYRQKFSPFLCEFFINHKIVYCVGVSP